MRNQGQVIWASTELCLCSQKELCLLFSCREGGYFPFSCLQSIFHAAARRPAKAPLLKPQIRSCNSSAENRMIAYPSIRVEARADESWFPLILPPALVSLPPLPSKLQPRCSLTVPETRQGHSHLATCTPAAGKAACPKTATIPHLPSCSSCSHGPGSERSFSDCPLYSSSKPDPCLWSTLCCHRIWEHLGSAGGKEPTCWCQRPRDAGSLPGSGRFLGGGHGNPLQYSCLENPMVRAAWGSTVHRVT